MISVSLILGVSYVLIPPLFELLFAIVDNLCTWFFVPIFWLLGELPKFRRAISHTILDDDE